MAGATRTPLVRNDASRPETVASLAIAVAVTLIAVGIASLFGLVGVTTTIGGVSAITVVGGLLVALGGSVVGLGVGSALGYVETEPSPTAGLGAIIAFSGIWFVLGGAAASLVFDSGIAWIPAGAVTGVGAFVTTATRREDIGSTLPAGMVAIVVGGTFVTGTIGPSWVLNLGFEQQASITATFLVPAATIASGLLAGWAAGTAYGGFGARGRRMGAYLLIYVNASAIIGVLFLLIAFTAVRGIPGLVTGATVGLGTGPTVSVLGVSIALPVSIPFVMNGVSLLNDFQGVLPAIVGTIWLVVGAVAFAVPLGVGAAVFLTEYAERGRLTQAVEVATNGLWSTPSIVFGLFGFTFLVPRFGGNKSLLAGMVTLGFMLLPLVLITSREALLAVPDEYRDASAALGVSKWQTIRSVVVPAAIPGVVTGVILGVGRIAGETAPILLTMTGGTFVSGDRAADVIGGFAFTSQPPFVTNPELLQATTALPFQLYALITAGVGLGDNVSNPVEFQWATAFVLLLVVLSFYAVGIGARYYFRRQLRHE